ncbi:hypothetical protein LY76DRAFT_599636, partial [Colletotrichum caudatum]
YSRTGSTADLEEAINAARETIEATPDDHADRPLRLNNLGVLLGNRYSRTGVMPDLDEARMCFKEAFNTKSVSPSERIRASTKFLSLPNILQDVQTAYTVAETAVNLVPLLSPFSLKSADKHHQLRQAVGLASDAAAIALHAGHRPLAALQLLETGRGVLAGSLQNIRTDLSALQQSHPDLADAFVHLRNQLDAPAQRSGLAPFQPQLTKPASVDPDYRHKASADMDSLVLNIRSRPGFERFLLSATEEEILEAAVEGPIIVINVSSHRCDALIVERSGIRSLEERAGDLGSATTLEWLWDVVVGPVLDVLGFTALPTGDTWPHVWWIPTGPLTRFPLHAAGHRVVSSYSPSIRSITRADIETPRKGSEVLSKLVNATRETDAVRKPPAHKKDVLAALENCRIFHFAGHGGAHPDPLQSLLLLKDWEKDPLMVESLLETNLSTRTPFLAYLSACGTGRIRDNRSIDESIHLTSAFQLAGFRHVIGTLWEVDDELCALSDESISRGLHHATKTLRDKDIEPDKNARHEQALWIPYVHYGM